MILMMMIWKWLYCGMFISICYGSHDPLGEQNALLDMNGGGVERLEAINGTPNYRVIKPEKDTEWFPEREIKLDSCVRRARCDTLRNTTCFGARLPYSKTSVHLTFYNSQNQIQNQLSMYKGLINVPKCWAVIQPFLCATFMPKCERILGQDMVYLPSYEMCKITMEPCAILYNTTYFPSFLKCNATLFPPKCDNTIREMKFNTTGKCLPPLIYTPKAHHFYEGMTGCGLPCRDPLYTEDEHHQIHRLIAWGAGVCLFLNMLTIATFLIDWRSANKYPALVIFYINVCFAVASMGWLVQFGVGAREDIVCSKDGTRRKGEPSAEENLSCVVVFVLVYYFMMAACVWFVIFTYAWHMSFRALGKMQDRIDKKAAYFHLVAWSLPLVLTITTMAFGEIDGSSVTGICFVGYMNHSMRVVLLLVPLALVLVIGGYFLLRGVFSLIAVKVSSKDVISPRAANKIRQTITRCSVTAALVAVFICVTFFCHIYEFRNADSWTDSFRKTLICRLEALREGGEGGECAAGGSRPSVSALQLRLACVFLSGVLMASWTWTPAAAAAWKRYFARRCGCALEAERARRARKHELIARAYRRRAEFALRGRLSISLGADRRDPVALGLSAPPPDDAPDSGELSSSWAANLPRFVRRRDALVLPALHHHAHHSLSSTPDRRNSQDSISISLRHVSVESRRNSLDSQLSVKIAEMKTKVGRRRTKHSKTKRKTRSSSMMRKESTPSIESQISRYWLQAVAANNDRSREEVKFSFE